MNKIDRFLNAAFFAGMTLFLVGAVGFAVGMIVYLLIYLLNIIGVLVILLFCSLTAYFYVKPPVEKHNEQYGNW